MNQTSPSGESINPNPVHAHPRTLIIPRGPVKLASDASDAFLFDVAVEGTREGFVVTKAIFDASPSQHANEPAHVGEVPESSHYLRTPENGFYQHTDGGLYEVLGGARMADDGQQAVVYRHVWPFEAIIWIRNVDEWAGRFTPILKEEVEAATLGDRTAKQVEITTKRETRKFNEKLLRLKRVPPDSFERP